MTIQVHYDDTPVSPGSPLPPGSPLFIPTTDGSILGIYDTDIHTVIPDPNIAVSLSERDDIIASPNTHKVFGSPPTLTVVVEFVPLDELKENTKKIINDTAEQVLLDSGVLEPIHPAIRQEKFDEATDFVAAGYPSFGSPPMLIGSPIEYPFVLAESTALGITLMDAADDILAKKGELIGLGSAIEEIRITGNIAVDSAIDDTGVQSALDTAIGDLEAL